MSLLLLFSACERRELEIPRRDKPLPKSPFGSLAPGAMLSGFDRELGTPRSIRIAQCDVSPHRGIQLTSTSQSSTAQITSSYLRGPPPRFWTCAQISACYLRTAEGSRRRKCKECAATYDDSPGTSLQQKQIAKDQPCTLVQTRGDLQAIFGRLEPRPFADR